MVDNNVKNQDLEINEKQRLRLMPLKVITGVIYGLALAFVLTIFLIGVINDTGESDFGLAILLILLLVYGSIIFAVTMIPAIIGLIITIAKRKKYQIKGSLVYFIIFSVLPVVTFIGFILATQIAIKLL